LGQMSEIRRVLKKAGLCYFSTANRNFPIEGFTKIPLLHYLPRVIFGPLYKMIRKTDIELYLLGYRGMIKLIETAGFSYSEYTLDIMKKPAKYNSEYTILSHIPLPAFLSPTNVFILSNP
jgi:SAM-dependent methyltransferase